MRFGSVCSGVEAASVAWEPLGWKASWFSEIEPFPSAVLAHRFPEVPNLGDMTKIHETKVFDDEPIDLLVGGTPCQSFSVAGLRKGMADPRGNLALVYLALAHRKRPRWIVWENVPGVLSSNGGRDFGAFLGGLGQLGYGFAYRVFDAQYFGVAQRRRRVFVVGYLGDWRPAAAVLFEPHSMQGHSAPRREAGERVADGTEGSAAGGSDPYIIDRAAFNQGKNAQYDPAIGKADAMPSLVARGPHAVAARMTAFGEYQVDGTASTVKARDFKDATDLIAFHASQDPISGSVVPSIGANATLGVAKGMAVRRLTPRECERLQGFPDDHTLVAFRGKPAADGPRYKAMGNSMAVPVMRWIGTRIQEVDAAWPKPAANDNAVAVGAVA